MKFKKGVGIFSSITDNRTQNTNASLPTLDDFGKMLSEIISNTPKPSEAKPLYWYMSGYLFKNTGKQILIETSFGWVACKVNLKTKKVSLI